ncbi:DUF6883 domain-containing protein [Microseira wollei]|uniref:DUF6883 domain-containing protein n=1 Tax=Microseira wollei NIES-4236 TaxID=2530354 RepID=A0AAV3X1R9_9CYAN|nr:DUF6883 domain-containing protein [Microseira wollei]GET35750.1 hypothetical protein MiSe_04950 [Microseira wollei NIES-4236]
MKLPNYELAVVPQQKITDYLLSPTHPDGRSKEKFFTAFGFSLDDWETLKNALLRHVAFHDVTKVEDSPFGTRYVVEGSLLTPDSRNPLIRSVWFVETGEIIPKFATAYPLKRREQ